MNKSQKELYEKIVNILVEKFGQDESKLSLNTNIIKDLDFDSLDIAELYTRLENHLDLRERASVLQLANIRTIEDIIDLAIKLQ